MMRAGALLAGLALLTACSDDPAAPTPVETEIPEELQEVAPPPASIAEVAGIGTPMEERVATIGLLYILQQAALTFYGPDARPVVAPFDWRIQLPWFGWSGYKLFVIAAACAILTGLWLLLSRTRIGLVMRATQYDSETARAFGKSRRRKARRSTVEPSTPLDTLAVSVAVRSRFLISFIANLPRLIAVAL